MAAAGEAERPNLDRRKGGTVDSLTRRIVISWIATDVLWATLFIAALKAAARNEEQA